MSIQALLTSPVYIYRAVLSGIVCALLQMGPQTASYARSIEPQTVSFTRSGSREQPAQQQGRTLRDIVHGPFTDGQALANNELKTPAVERIFSRQATLGRRAQGFERTPAGFGEKKFPTGAARLPGPAGGFSKQSVESGRAAPRLLVSRAATGLNQRAGGLDRSATFADRSFRVSEQSPLAMTSAPGFDRDFPVNEFRGRLPHQAVQAMDELKMRHLTIDEVRDLLNKHRRPQ